MFQYQVYSIKTLILYTIAAHLSFSVSCMPQLFLYPITIIFSLGL